MKRFGIGVGLLFFTIVFFPSIKTAQEVLIDLFDSMFPGASVAITTMVHAAPIITLLIMGGCGLYLIISTFRHRGEAQ